jgi:hypothetical protein
MARKHPTRIAFLVGILLAFAACMPTVIEEDVRLSLYQDGRCDNEAAVVDNELRRQEGSLKGDLDGDDSEDEAYIVADRAGKPGCRSFLVMSVGSSRYSATIDPSGQPRSLAVPTLHSLAEIDGYPGLETVVNVEMGASTQFVSVFTFGDERTPPQQLELRGKPPGPFAGELGNLFAYGGSVGHLEAVDCLDEHVVMSVALPVGDSADTYEVERHYFAPEGNQLVLNKALTEKVMVAGLKIDDFPEFAGSPFGSCD